jgi:hypothetical protein
VKRRSAVSLAAFGGLSPSLRVEYRHPGGWRCEGTIGYIENASRFHAGGGATSVPKGGGR